MAWQRHTLQLLAASPDPELQLRAAIGAHDGDVDHDVVAQLCINPHLGGDVAEWLTRRWAEQPDACGIAGRHICEVTSPAMRAALDTPTSPLPAAATCSASWISTSTVVEVIADCDDDELAGVLTELVAGHLTRPDVDTDRVAAVATAVWERWERWFLDGAHTGWVPVAHLFETITRSMRRTGRQWFTPPGAELGPVGLQAWWEDLTPFASAAHLVGSIDALTHPHCEPPLAARALESICEYTTGADGSLAAFVTISATHAAAHPTHGPATVAAAATALTAGADDLQFEELAAQLVEHIGDSLLAELDCGTVRDLTNHNRHQYWIRERVAALLTERCGRDTEAAIALLAAGFSGTISELCDVITTGDTARSGAHLEQPGTLDVQVVSDWVSTLT